MRLAKRLIVALDSTSLPEALHAAKLLQGLVRYVKIGSALFTAVGPQAVQRMRTLGFEVVLDLKFHDIPSTVERSCRAAVHHRVAMLTIHASGQPQMLTAAVRGVREEARRLRIRAPAVVGVTVLTSVAASPVTRGHTRVLRLALEAKRAGLDGVVCSAWEARTIRRRCGRSFVIVCPGIRPKGSEAADQTRVASPSEAVAYGADFLVVGRPVTHASDPRRAIRRILEEMEEGLAC